MSLRQIWLNLGALGLLIALLGLADWLNTGVRAVPGLIEDLHGEDMQAQSLAAMQLGKIGPAAKAAVPALVNLAQSGDSYPASTAAGALPSIDLSAARQVMAAWLPKLQDPNPQVRRGAASTLAALGPAAKPAVPALLMRLNDQDLVVRERAVRAVGAIGLPIDAVMPGLMRALRDPEWTVRYAAVTQFSFSGFSSPESRAILQELTKDAHQTVARLAQTAVASADRPIPLSVHHLTLDQPVDRTYTLHQVAKLGPRAAEVAPKLAALLTAERPLERYLAASALESIGPPAKESLPALEQAAQDPDPVVRDAVAQAIQSIARDRSIAP